MSVLCIPAECDNIKLPFDGEIASRGMHICCVPFAGFSYAPFRIGHYAKPSLHTCLHTSNPYGIFFSQYHYATNGVRPSNLYNF